MVKTELSEGRTFRVLALVSIVSVLSACALIPTYVKAPDLQIEKRATPTARVISAYLSTNRLQLSLYGQVVARSVSKRPLRGRLDISIIRPNTEDVTCLTTPDLVGAGRIQKSWRVRIRWPDDKAIPSIRMRCHHQEVKSESGTTRQINTRPESGPR